MRRGVDIGCLVLLMIPVVLVACFWYTFRQAERENDRREKAAFEALLRQAHDAADRTADALTGSGDGGTDAVLGVIWEHTGSPVITHDADRRAFTAVAARSAVVDREPVPPVGGPVTVRRCFTYTYVRRTGPAWTSEVTERDLGACRGSGRIGDSVFFARVRLAGLEPARLTRAGVRSALEPGDPPDDEGRFAVRSVVRTGRTVVAVVLVRYVDRYYPVPAGGPAVAEQCYRLTRILDPDGGAGRTVTAVPVAEAAC
ncbi:hypothetical protein ACF07S_04295 [Streptomyces sp. NPDC016640]|uniref:hypothetical protein n=1 Tax=Streptomyces sp. NPDC016640 TaxID=3364969 RepID=UPI0036F9CA97